VTDLIDTTEMYLRTIFELEEEGIVPLRARIAERLGQSGPTVSQTVARMARDGLLSVEGGPRPPGSCASTGWPSACWST
jgi:DtxR family Mn-dependent transcriptional regulator